MSYKNCSLTSFWIAPTPWQSRTSWSVGLSRCSKMWSQVIYWALSSRWLKTHASMGTAYGSSAQMCLYQGLYCVDSFTFLFSVFYESHAWMSLRSISKLERNHQTSSNTFLKYYSFLTSLSLLKKFSSTLLDTLLWYPFLRLGNPQFIMK